MSYCNCYSGHYWNGQALGVTLFYGDRHFASCFVDLVNLSYRDHCVYRFRYDLGHCFPNSIGIGAMNRCDPFGCYYASGDYYRIYYDCAAAVVDLVDWLNCYMASDYYYIGSRWLLELLKYCLSSDFRWASGVARKNLSNYY